MCNGVPQNDFEAVIRAIQLSQDRPVYNPTVKIDANSGMLRRRWDQAVAAYMRDVEREVLRDGGLRPGPRLVQFERSMQSLIRRLHIQAEIIAARGDDESALSGAAFSRISAAVASQNGYLANWVSQLQGEDAETLQANTAAILRRARLYAETAYNQLERAFTASLAIPLLPFYPKDGRTECLMNCQCVWDYRRVVGGWDCFWVINLNFENCPTCKRRARIAAPLRVRDGIIQRPNNLSEAFRS